MRGQIGQRTSISLFLLLIMFSIMYCMVSSLPANAVLQLSRHNRVADLRLFIWRWRWTKLFGLPHMAQWVCEDQNLFVEDRGVLAWGETWRESILRLYLRAEIEGPKRQKSNFSLALLRVRKLFFLRFYREEWTNTWVKRYFWHRSFSQHYYQINRKKIWKQKKEL